jgi:hypothetical protein
MKMRVSTPLAASMMLALAAVLLPMRSQGDVSSESKSTDQSVTPADSGATPKLEDKPDGLKDAGQPPSDSSRMDESEAARRRMAICRQRPEACVQQGKSQEDSELGHRIQPSLEK